MSSSLGSFTLMIIFSLIKVIKFGTLLGELQVDERYVSNQTVLDQVVCTTVTLVEREKRRQRSLRGEKGKAPAASLSVGVPRAGDLEDMTVR